MKKFTLFILLISFQWAIAQQTPIYSEYMFNQLMINPALSGNYKSMNCNALYRSQWVGINGAPQTSVFTFDIPVLNDKVGLGVNFTHDQIGVYSNTDFAVNYAYHIELAKSRLSFGLQGGFSHLDANYIQVKYSRENDNTDEAFGTYLSTTKPIFGAGCYYQTNKFYVGFSIPNLIFGNSDKLGYQQNKMVYLSTGYIFDISKNILIKPSVLMRYSLGLPVNMDINANVWIKNQVAVGLSYRTGDSFVSLLEVKLNNNFKIGFSHDFNVSPISKYNKGSNEIMIKYQFVKEKFKFLTMQY